MKHNTISFVFLTAIICNTILQLVVEAAEELDLYIRDKYETSDGSKCDSCDTSEGGCYRSSRTLFLKDTCFNRGISKSSIYNEVSTNIVCRQDFSATCKENKDRNPKFDAQNVDDCRDTWQLKECVDGERMARLSNWCIESNQPIDEFVVPLLQFKEYDSLGDCGTSEYTTLYRPDMGGVCLSHSFKKTINGTYVSGSKQASCLNSNTYSAVNYMSTDCTGSDIELGELDGTSNECPTTDPKTALWSDGEENIYTVNCDAPTIYCKASVSFSGKADWFAAESNDNSSSDYMSASYIVGCLVMMVSIVLLLWEV